MLPKDELREKWGIERNAENFWLAVRQGKSEIVALFLKGKIEIDLRRLHELLSDKQALGLATLAPLVSNVELKEQFCSSDEEQGSTRSEASSRHRRSDRLHGYARDHIASDFMRQLCAGTDFLAPIERQHDAVRMKNEEVARQNLRTKRLLEQCLLLGRDDAKERFRTAMKIPNWTCAHPAIQSRLDQELCDSIRRSAVEAIDPWEGYVNAYCVRRFRIVELDLRTRSTITESHSVCM